MTTLRTARTITLPDPVVDTPCPGCIGFRVGGAGNVKLGFSDGGTDTIQALLAGEQVDLEIQKIFASPATTATKITLFLRTL